MLKGFKDFVLRGNVIDLAVAVVIGAAFGAVVKAFVDNLMTPLIAAIFGEPDFSGLAFTINGSIFRYGLFIIALITFVLLAAAVYFVVVASMNKLAERGAPAPSPSSAPSASARSRTGRARARSAARRKRRNARLSGERPPRPPGR